MVKLITPPEGFSLSDFERRWALEHPPSATNTSKAEVRASPAVPVRNSSKRQHRHRRELIAVTLPVMDMFQTDVRKLLSDLYRLEDGYEQVNGQSFTHLIDCLRTGWGTSSGVAWAIPTRYGPACDLLASAGFAVSRGRGTRSYWKPDKWSGLCDVVHERAVK